ncbi:MAG: glycosyltransferase [Flavobacteriaceae bacterium]|nr:glycosyltransferase [Flavobacteriaceae bacterium]MDH3795694.1 glycosyltransferase [Flavobacteriaceae bacterium]
MVTPAPLISILIPFKNTAVYLPECLESIRSQSYSNWEVCAVNDHSTDASLALLETWSQRDPRFKVAANPGKGIIPALRKALEMSSGELITRMDSDDIMKRDKLKFLCTPLYHNGPGYLAIGGVRYFSERGISDGYARYERWLNKLTAAGNNYSELYKECVIPSPCWMTFREDLFKAGAFDADRYPEDYDLAFRFYKAELKCIPCNDILHDWRDYEERTSRNHEHYAQNYFLKIKLHYFLDLHYQASRPLTLWGAGAKGKEIAQDLTSRNVPFHWLCDNPKKIGKNIYGNLLLHFSEIEKMDKPQCIITVANEVAQIEISAFMDKRGFQSMQDYFFFC